MSVIGMIEYNWENADHHKQYVLPMYVPGCAEFFNMNAKILESNPEMGTFFEHYVPFATGENYSICTGGWSRYWHACHSGRKSNRDGK